MSRIQKALIGALVVWVVYDHWELRRMGRYLNHLADCTQQYMAADIDEDVRGKFDAMAAGFGDVGGDTASDDN